MNTYRVWFTERTNDYPMMVELQSINADCLASYLSQSYNVVSVEPLTEWMN